MPNYDKLIKKIDEAVDLLKADPKTKLPGILVNKAVGHVPTPAIAPNLDPNPYQATKEVQPKSGIPLKAPASPKPMASKLPKNSQMHMKEEMNKMWPMVAGSEKDEKGVHTSGGFSGLEEKGQSQAGRLIERGKQPQPNEYYNRLYHERGKHMHRENLKELKNMPKPNLPKSEEMNKDAMGSFGGNSSFTRNEEMAKSFKSLVHKLMNRTNKRTGKPYTKEQADKVAGAINAKYVHHYRKSEENPDEKADARLGERVEHDIEQHFKENASAERKEGHNLEYKKAEDMNKYVSYSGTAGNIAGMAASEKNPPAEDPREIAGLDKAQDPRLRAWLKKAVGCMHKCMAKSDYEKERMTDGNVANVRREEIQEEQRAAGKDMVNTHKKVVAERKDDAIKDDKGHSVTHPGRKLLVPDATKNSMAFKSEEMSKSWDSMVHKLMNETNKRTGKKYTKEEADKIAGEINARYVHHYRKSEEMSKFSAGEVNKHAAPGVDKKKFDRCVKEVKAKGSADNAYAVCNASLKSEEMDKALGGAGSPAEPTSRPDTGYGAIVAKDQEGVHQAHFMASPKTGTSEVGARMAPGGASPKTNKWAKGEHTKIFNTLKAMKKPNLP